MSGPGSEKQVESVSRPGHHIGLRRALSSTGRMVESTVKQYLPSLTHSISIYELQRGDHIYAYRAAGIYSHHGIYVGNFQVIHFNGEPGTSMLNMEARIIRDTLDHFLADSSLRRYKYGASTEEHFMKRKGTCCKLESDHPDAVVARALNCLENQGMPRYNLLKFNCEHFAIYCKLGNRILDLGDGWMGQLQEVISLPLYPIKAVGAALALWDRGQRSRAIAREQDRPIEERFQQIVGEESSESGSCGTSDADTVHTSSSLHACSLRDDEEENNHRANASAADSITRKRSSTTHENIIDLNYDHSHYSSPGRRCAQVEKRAKSDMDDDYDDNSDDRKSNML